MSKRCFSTLGLGTVSQRNACSPQRGNYRDVIISCFSNGELRMLENYSLTQEAMFIGFFFNQGSGDIRELLLTWGTKNVYRLFLSLKTGNLSVMFVHWGLRMLPTLFLSWSPGMSAGIRQLGPRGMSPRMFFSWTLGMSAGYSSTGAQGCPLGCSSAGHEGCQLAVNLRTKNFNMLCMLLLYRTIELLSHSANCSSTGGLEISSGYMFFKYYFMEDFGHLASR